MQINRRNFLKIAGVATAAAMLPVKGLGSEISAKNQLTDKSLKKIYDEAYKKHPPKFNMCGYAAPKLETVRVGFIGVGS
ncbi:MAG: twin-arginine translocation signal domain-containing protein, partial [Bacillota bacterium]